MTEPTPGPSDAGAELRLSLAADLRSIPRDLLLSGCFGGGPAGALDGTVPLLVPVEQELFRRIFDGEPDDIREC